MTRDASGRRLAGWVLVIWILAGISPCLAGPDAQRHAHPRADLTCSPRLSESHGACRIAAASCYRCSGTGKCWTCNGSGKSADERSCYVCSGTGKCYFCSGSGECHHATTGGDAH